MTSKRRGCERYKQHRSGRDDGRYGVWQVESQLGDAPSHEYGPSGRRAPKLGQTPGADHGGRGNAESWLVGLGSIHNRLAEVSVKIGLRIIISGLPYIQWLVVCLRRLFHLAISMFTTIYQ